MNVIRVFIATLFLFGTLLGCSAATVDTELSIDRDRSIDQRCSVGKGESPSHHCCGYIVSEEGQWKGPMDNLSECAQLTAGRGVFNDGYCSLDCASGEVVVELRPRL